MDSESGEEIEEVEINGATRPGELWVKGSNVMLGYLNRPDATDEIIDSDGFLNTSDIATSHKDGHFRSSTG